LKIEPTGEFWQDLKFNSEGLIPAVIQEETTGEVLMLAYMNEESLARTLKTGETWFYSRSRRELWHKGATSGHRQRVKGLYYDCDGDTLLVKVQQEGNACHEGYHSCFFRELTEQGVKMAGGEDARLAAVIGELFEVIKSRQDHRPEGAYTTYLFDQGQDKILKKVGEEAAEVIIASKNNNQDEVRYELADLVYHCLVLLASHQMTPEEIARELQSRRS